MIFNMGGHPGQAVCKCLFERRSFRVNKIWQTKVIQASKTLFTGFFFFFFPSKTHYLWNALLQAADTDISALVEIEKNSPHHFEFFIRRSGDQPICARTAWAYGKAGGIVFLMLYQFTAVNFVNQIRCSLWLSLHFYEVEVYCTWWEGQP